MPVQQSEYWVRVKVVEDGSNAYHAAFDLARKISHENPGLTVEVAQDKVWFTSTYKESNATPELQD